MPSKPKTKIEEEWEWAISYIKSIGTGAKSGYSESTPPSWFSTLVDDLIYSPATVWFCAGLAVEAAGITIQMLLRIDSYPIVDAIVGGILAFAIYQYQKTHERPR